jgi:hypothetical protein
MAFAPSFRINLAARCIALVASPLCAIAAVAQANLPSCPNFASDSSWDNCEGTKTFATGGKYVGEFRNGQLHGRGKHIYSDGSTYVGEFRGGNFNGQGVLSYVNGDKYVGQFADGKPNGSGTLEYANGANYVGEFRDGQPNGKGTKTFSNKSKYAGEIKDGVFDGRGTLTLHGGAKYVGEFKEGNPSGAGKYFAAGGAPLSTEVGSEKVFGIDSQIIRMERNGGVYVVPVRFNDIITLNAIIDSGASDVSIPADIVLTLMRTNTVTVDDFMGSATYVLADGSKVPSQQFRIRSLKVGNRTVQNVTASIASAKASILLGQSFLSRFKTWSVDNEQHTLVLR